MTVPRCTIVSPDGRIRQGDLDQPPGEGREDYEYFLNICRLLAQRHGLAQANFLIVHDTSGPLPGLDERSIVLVAGDERCRLPVECERALLVLKCYGDRPRHPGPLRLRFASLLDHVRHGTEVARWHLAAARLGLERKQRLVAKIACLPMGYCRQEPVPFVPLEERPYLVSFAGSLDNVEAHPLSYQGLANWPKRQARLALLAALRRLERELPPSAVHLRLTASFAASLAEAGEGYAAMMMHTRICVCPRGTRMETFRIHEGLRFGCIVISQRLPDFWFFRGSPVIQLDDWAELPGIVQALRADPERMRRLHEESLRWWREVCSPSAVAAHAARLLTGQALKLCLPREPATAQLQPP
jgi:hypothetical protein